MKSIYLKIFICFLFFPIVSGALTAEKIQDLYKELPPIEMNAQLLGEWVGPCQRTTNIFLSRVSSARLFLKIEKGSEGLLVDNYSVEFNDADCTTIYSYQVSKLALNNIVATRLRGEQELYRYEEKQSDYLESWEAPTIEGASPRSIADLIIWRQREGAKVKAIAFSRWTSPELNKFPRPYPYEFFVYFPDRNEIYLENDSFYNPNKLNQVVYFSPAPFTKVNP